MGEGRCIPTKTSGILHVTVGEKMGDTQHCLVPNCTNKTYAPAGTGVACKEHFLEFLKWRRKKGAQMFSRYAAMTMSERDVVATEWVKTVSVE
jgi:hypothetical protein